MVLRRAKYHGKNSLYEWVSFTIVVCTTLCISKLFFDSQHELSIINRKKLALVNYSTKHISANSSCIVVGCFTNETVGVKQFWGFYSNSGYTTILTNFGRVTYNSESVYPTWCRIPVVLDALMRYPHARIVYVDIDTLVDLGIWCNMPHLGEHAPIIMTSLYRKERVTKRKYTVHGTQVQANSFVVSPGLIGERAMLRWEGVFGTHELRDQGAIHNEEQGLCGVPGWIQCYGNPFQQSCHCAGSFKGNISRKKACIEMLFNGTKSGCNRIHFKESQLI